MILEFTTAFSAAASAAVTAAAWLSVILIALLALAVLALLLGAVFDAATRALAWYWKRTKHQPRNRLERILMGATEDGV